MRGIYQQIIKQEKSFGLDISSNTIKALELKIQGKSLSLVNISQTSIPMSAYIAGVIRQPEIVADNIRKMIAEKSPKGFDTTKVICSLPDDKTYQHIIQIPQLPPNKMEAALILKIPTVIPMPMDTIYWDWSIVDVNSQTHECKVLIVAVEKETLDSFVHTLQLAGLEPIAFETSQTAALRVIKGKDFQKTNTKVWCLINIGKSMTLISLVIKGSLEYTTSVHFGTNQLSKIFGEYYKLTNEDEITYKIITEGLQIDQGKDPDLFNQVITTAKPLDESIASIINYYTTTYNQEGQTPIDEIILFGEGASIAGLAEKVGDVYKIPTRCAENSFKILPGPQWIQHQKIYPFLTVLGLSIIGKQGEDMSINLLPKMLKDELRNYYILTKGLFFTKLVTLNLIIFSFLFGVFSYITMTVNAQYQNQVKANENILNSQKYSSLHQQVDNLNTQLENINTASSQQLNWLPVLQELGSITPSGVTVTNTSIITTSTTGTGPWSIQINGTAATRDAILRFQQNLENSKYFSDIQLPLSDITVSSNIKFSIKGTVASVPSL